MCPGRFLAKNTIITTSVLMASMFELEILTDSIEARASLVSVLCVQRMRFASAYVEDTGFCDHRQDKVRQKEMHCRGCQIHSYVRNV